MKFRLWLTVLSFLLAALTAPGALVTLVAPFSAVAPGTSVTVELLIANSSAEAVDYVIPSALSAQLTQDSRQWSTTLEYEQGAKTIPAGGFMRVPLVVALPADATGRLVLEIGVPVMARALLEVGPTRTHTNTNAHGAVSDAATAPPILPAASRLKRYYADHFSGHEPMYFVYGGDKPAAKFQFSLKYRILNDSGPLALRFPSLRGLHIAYTQRSLWALDAASSPFYDTSYMPEGMFESLAADTGKHTGVTWLGYQAAIQHESNGKDGIESRSLNTFYFRPMLVIGDPEGWRLILRPKFFVYLGDVGNNPDIRQYRGYSELRAIFGQANRLSISVTGRVGEKLDHGSVQVDASYPTEFLTGNFALYLLAQYWNGYGESLRSYTLRSETVRLGFSLAR